MLDWRGECVAIVASGPSVSGVNVDALCNRIHVIAINESYRKCPRADILYGCDAAWWKLRAGVPEFAGLKIRGLPVPALPQAMHDEKACKKYGHATVNVVSASDDLLIKPLDRIGSGGNSGFQALNLAVQFGATGIALIGFDMRHGHWHGRHPQPLLNPDESCFPRWRRAFDGAAVHLKRLGVDVVNCSPVSMLNAYPKMTVDAALARWGL